MRKWKRLVAFLAVAALFLLCISSASAYNGDTIVYRTRTGECYHKKSCSYLRQSSIPIKLSDAVAYGLRPCSRCKPPELDETRATPAKIQTPTFSPRNDEEYYRSLLEDYRAWKQEQGETGQDGTYSEEKQESRIYLPAITEPKNTEPVSVKPESTENKRKETIDKYVVPALAVLACIFLLASMPSPKRGKGEENMDITLQRILSLLPHKPDGTLEHGARKAFAQSIGLKNGNLVSDWVKGRTNSYNNYLYEIAAKYDVSVEWLRGETDEKKPAKDGGPVTPEERASRERLELLDSLFLRLTPEEQQRFLGRLEGIALSRAAEDRR